MSGGWAEVSAQLCRRNASFYELEPGGALALALDDENWMLELTPDGRVICQAGIDMDDLKSLLSDGTPEDLGTDELAKQAKYYLQPVAAKVRKAFLGAGFEETTEMNDEYVAVTFHRPVDLSKPDDIADLVGWCKRQCAHNA
jgi:hypothetical protein